MSEPEVVMQVVKITHERCGEYDCRTFVLAPGEWTEDDIDTRVERAQVAYLLEFAKAKEAENGPPNPGYQPNYAAHPDRLVGDLLAEHKEAKALYAAWEAAMRKTRRTFESFLTEQGFVSLWEDESGIVEINCDWGHRHGQRLSYGDDSIDTMPSPAELAGVPDLDAADFG